MCVFYLNISFNILLENGKFFLDNRTSKIDCFHFIFVHFFSTHAHKFIFLLINYINIHIHYNRNIIHRFMEMK